MFRTLARYLALLALAIWVGALVFFGAILAPTAFKLLASPNQAGLLIGTTLRQIHVLGLGCGVVAVIFLLITGWGKLGKNAFAIALVLVMMGLTEASQYVVIPAMERDRAAVEDISALPPGNPERDAFDTLHQQSEWLEEGVLVCGLAALAFAFAAPRYVYDDGLPVE
jgi:uncharacterized membrane-anchored protein YitT (DUF2179 family)